MAWMAISTAVSMLAHARTHRQTDRLTQVDTHTQHTTVHGLCAGGGNITHLMITFCAKACYLIQTKLCTPMPHDTALQLDSRAATDQSWPGRGQSLKKLLAEKE
eukprot:1273667-Rhodomonas_salina.1